MFKKKNQKKKGMMDVCVKGGCGPGGGGIYGLGVIGAAVYYISTASGFWVGAWGLVKALLWPAFLIFELLRFVGA